jgi:hypothetical protein
MRSILVLVPLLATGCRPDPGTPSYPEPSGWGVDTADTSFLAGPDPYLDGEQRLSLGAFYEGGYSELLPVDDVNIFYYIYNNYTQAEDSNDRVEGYVSDVWTVSGSTWFGGGINATVPVDLSAWDTLHFSVKGQPSETLKSLTVQVETAAGTAPYELFDSGFALDSEWYTFAVPLSFFSSDLSSVSGLFVLVSDAGGGGDVVKIDNLYYTAE